MLLLLSVQNSKIEYDPNSKFFTLTSQSHLAQRICLIWIKDNTKACRFIWWQFYQWKTPWVCLPIEVLVPKRYSCLTNQRALETKLVSKRGVRTFTNVVRKLRTWRLPILYPAPSLSSVLLDTFCLKPYNTEPLCDVHLYQNPTKCTTCYMLVTMANAQLPATHNSKR